MKIVLIANGGEGISRIIARLGFLRSRIRGSNSRTFSLSIYIYMCIFVPLSFIFPLFLHSTFTFPSHSIPVPLSPPPVCIARSAYFRKLCLPFLKTLIRFHSDETLSRSRNRKDTSLPCCSGHSEKRLAVFVGELARLCSAWKREGRGGEGGKHRGEIFFLGLGTRLRVEERRKRTSSGSAACKRKGREGKAAFENFVR